MTFAIIDTLKWANTLKAAGVPPEMAEAKAIILGEMATTLLAERAKGVEMECEIERLQDEVRMLRARTA